MSHRIEKSYQKTSSRKTIVRFINRKYCKKALVNREKLTNIYYLSILYTITSLFSTVCNATESANLLNKDLKKISEWTFNWKMLFNPDITKQAQEVIFSRKNTMLNHPTFLMKHQLLILHVKSILGCI